MDFLLAEIRRLYEELNEFWKEEIRHVTEALNQGRTDPRDFKLRNNFYSSLKRTIEFWKVGFSPFALHFPTNQNTLFRVGHQAMMLKPYAATLCLLLQFVYFSFGLTYLILIMLQGADLGAIASSLSTTMGSLENALERMFSSASLQYSQLGRSSFQRVYIAFAGNSDLCLSFLRHCVDYGEKVFSWRLASISSPTSDVPHDPPERITVRRPEVTGESSKSLEGVGGGGALLHRRNSHCLSTGTSPTHSPPDPTFQGFTVSRATNKDPRKPVIMIKPPAGPTGEPIEDRQRILSQKILLQCPSQTLLQLIQLPLKDKVMVCSKRSSIHTGSQT